MPKSLLAKKIILLQPSATETVENLVKRMEQKGIDDIVSLGAGEPCFDTPDNIKKAAVDALMAGDTKYQPTAGSYELREEICRKFKRENGIDVGCDDVLVTAGGKFAIFLAFQALLEKDDQVILLEPAWVTYGPAANLAGATIIPITMDPYADFQPDPERIRAQMSPAVKIIVLNSPCNPTGAVYDNAVVREIAKIARDHNALLLSDEVYEYQRYQGVHYSPASEFDNVLTVNSFSKSHAMTGWRLGYVTGPRPVLEGMIKIYQHSTSCVTAFAQAGAIEALRSPNSHEAVKKMLAGYRKRRTLMLECIARSKYLILRNNPCGAFYCFPAYQMQISSLALSKALLEEMHVATVPGAAFGSCGEGYLRLSYATTLEQIKEAFERMELFFKKL